MNYTTRSGIILEEICGEYALIPEEDNQDR